jgi:hypothetical protein
MTKTAELRYHVKILEIIERFKRPKWGKLISKDPRFNGLKVYFKPFKNEFKIEITYEIFSQSKKKLDVGQFHKNIQVKFNRSIYNLESLFLERQSPPKLTALIDDIYTIGFSKNSNYYYQLIIPLEANLNFHWSIEETHFETDLGYNTRSGTTAIINGESIQVCCIHDGKNQPFVVYSSNKKQKLEEFRKKTHAVMVAMGYISGYFTGNQGYFFAYTKKALKEPKYFKCTQLRNSIKSDNTPVHANSHTYINYQAKKYFALLRPISITEFSLLCKNAYESVDFESTLLLIMESNVASLLFRPGGYSIALESMSDLIIGSKKISLKPIKDNALSKKIRKELLEVLDKNKSSIPMDDFFVLQNRINQLNQSTNKSRLKAPFNILGITLLDEDLKILETRNDFLHGRYPDLTNEGFDRSLDRVNRDLLYCALRLYTLLNLLILKWIGFDNRIVNLPKIKESVTRIKLNEEPFRHV